MQNNVIYYCTAQINLQQDMGRFKEKKKNQNTSESLASKGMNVKK